ncbi:MAG: hypothetical protein FWC06_04385 [Treponema sp.]|nr:hypothetical protein [Treponema sp.]
MGDIFQTLIFVIIGIILISLGYFLFFGPPSPFYPLLPWNKKKIHSGKPGDPQVCPVCSMKMLKGDLIKTIAQTSGEYSTDRIVHIKGCYSCLENGLPRKCPICRTKLTVDDYLISRMFERKFQKNHIHVLGCNLCRKR